MTLSQSSSNFRAQESHNVIQEEEEYIEPIICSPTDVKDFLDYVEADFNESIYEKRIFLSKKKINNKIYDQLDIHLINNQNNEITKFKVIVR
jgi:hypothetical protein